MLDTTKAASIDVAGAITFEQLPGAHFFGQAAVEDHAYAATRYENCVDAYQITGDETELWEALPALGFDRDEIQWHVDNRGRRMEQGYCTAEKTGEHALGIEVPL
jgi:hypothetical protein